MARALAALLLWSAAYVGVFVLSGRGYATNFPWYFAPPLLVLAGLAAVGLAPACGRLERRAGPRASVALAAAAALAVALVVAPAVGAGIERVRLSFTAHRERAYAAAALWLARHGPVPSVASNEIGALAWFSPPGTEIVDLFGLARREPDRGVEWTELVARRRPVAIVTRADFRYRRTLEAERPGEWLWIRAGALDLGLEPALAERLRPHQDDLVTIYRQLDLGRSPR